MEPEEKGTVGKESDEQESAEEQVEWEESDSRSEQISSCNYAMSAIEGLDVPLLNKSQQAMVARIRRRCLRIIDYHIDDMYRELFEEGTEVDED